MVKETHTCPVCGKETTFSFNEMHRNDLHCPLCHTLVRHHSVNAIEKCLIYTLTGLFLYTVSIFYPFLHIQVGEIESSTTVFLSLSAVYESHPLVSIMGVLVVVVIPLLYLLLHLVFCLGKIYNFEIPLKNSWLIFLDGTRDWCMIDVFFFGILVSIFKLAGMMEFQFEVGFWCMMFLFLDFVFIAHYSDIAMFSDDYESSKHFYISNYFSLAFLSCAIFLYVPANIYPMMIVESFTSTTASTIWEGVVIFMQSGNYFIGIVIFTASIAIPLFKMVVLMFLLANHSRDLKTRRLKSKLYHIIEFIGKWSMIDVFVVCIFAGLVDIGALMKITGGPGANSFLLVVILTMLATMFFDPRVIWEDGE